jgi:hypothetical protein
LISLHTWGSPTVVKLDCSAVNRELEPGRCTPNTAITGHPVNCSRDEEIKHVAGSLARAAGGKQQQFAWDGGKVIAINKALLDEGYTAAGGA